MSTMTVNDMIPFFGRPGDNRVKLYLAALKHKFQKGEPLALNDQEELKNKYFVNREQGLNDEAVHPEWTGFVSALRTRMTGTASPAALEVVKRLGGAHAPSSNEAFWQKVVQEHSTVTRAGEDITLRPSEWGTATAVLYNIRLPLIIGSPMPDESRTEFGYRLDVYFVKALLEASARIPSAPLSTSFWALDAEEDGSYFRKHADPNKLYKIGADGNVIDVSLSAPDAVSRLSSQRCASTGLRADGATCGRYLLDCLINGSSENIDACKEFMMRPEYWDIAVEEVNDMLPAVAVQTLSKFGFKSYTEGDKEKVESVNEWSTRLGTVLSDEKEHKAIAGNDRLMGYLDLLVRKVNSNPTILNKNIVLGHPLEIDVADETDRFKGSYGWKIGLKPAFSRAKTNNINLLFARQSDLVKNTFYSFRKLIEHRVMFVPGSGLVMGGLPVVIGSPTMIGGGVQVLAPQVTGEFKESYPILKGYYDVAINKLKSSGKTLGSADHEQINKLLNSYKETEQKLVKAIKYVDKYIDLLDMYKQYDHNNVLQMNHLKSFVDARTKYFDRTETKLVSAFDVLGQMLTEAVERGLQEPETKETHSLRLP